MMNQPPIGPPKQQGIPPPKFAGQPLNRKSGVMGPTVSIGLKAAPRPPSGLNLPPAPSSPQSSGPAVDEYGMSIGPASPPAAHRPPPIQYGHAPRPSGSSFVPKFAAPTKNQPGPASGTSSPQMISSPLMKKQQPPQQQIPPPSPMGGPHHPPPPAAALTHSRTNSFGSGVVRPPPAAAAMAGAHMRNASTSTSPLASSPSPTPPQIASPTQQQMGQAASLGQIQAQAQAQAQIQAQTRAQMPPPMAKPAPPPAQCANVRMEDSSDRDSVTRALCDYMICQLEEGIRLLKKPEFTDVRCFVTKDHTMLGVGQVTFDGTSPEGTCDTSKAEMYDINTVLEIREITGGKPTLAVVFNNETKEIEFQCKDPNAYANFIDGMNALLGKAPATKDRNADIETIRELLAISQMYGPPQVPPPPPSIN